MVPDGWKEGRIKNLVLSLNAGVSVNSEDDGNKDAKYKILKTSCVSKGIFEPFHAKSVYHSNEIARLKENVTRDRIIISRMNTPLLVGANSYIESTIENIFLPDRLWQVNPKKNKVIMRWLSYWFASERIRFVLSNLGTGTSGSMKNITKSDVLDLKIYIPPLHEQKKISEILSTWDKAITTTEKLLANSEQQKKALMQQLLTGKKRLLDRNGKRFSEVWINSHLKALCSITTGKKDVNEGNPDGSYPFFTCASEPTKCDRYSYDCEALLISGNGIIGKTHYYNGKFEAYQRTYILNNFNESILVYYLYQFILYWLIHDILRESQHGAMPYIKLGLLEKFKILIPTIQEQNKIGLVLFAADQKIEKFKQKLEYLRNEKKALMQQLLTGKRRVKISGINND